MNSVPHNANVNVAPTRPAGAPPLRGTVIPQVIGKGFLLAAKARVLLWDRALKNVEAAQMKHLRKFVEHSKDTEFGRTYGFGSIRTYEDFQRNVPVGDYDSFWPSIERMMKGEKNVLVPEQIRYFGNSSGSSTKGKSKFLPIGQTQIKFQQGSAIDGVFRYLAAKNDDTFLSGYTLGLLPPTTMKPPGPSFVSYNPAFMAAKKPLISRPVWLPSRATREMTDYDKKLERIAEECMDYDVRAVAGTTCWFSLLFDKLIAAAKKRGRNISTVGELWPNLTILMGGGVSADPYMPVIRSRMGHDGFSLIDTYNATEGGIYAAGDLSGERGMLMIPDRGVFFEFVPLEEHDKSNPTRVPLWGVEKDKLYAIVVTTPSGLYAYKLGDIVRFPSVHPHRMEFAGRLSGCLSTTQELTTHVEIERAVDHAVKKHPATTFDFGCAADVGVSGSKSRYVLFVEFLPGGEPADLKGFGEAFDAGLCEQNRVYREHRANDTAILAPTVVSLPSGSVQRFMKESGMTSVQTKFPRILDDERKSLLRSFAI
ncbi:MAG: GH3 auxin-responsive promoter family protein [Polyangiaceae bacterium]|nr:GH3 auxin-responsive promoter family protein [Polyangiaceae bacterium]